MNIEQAKQKIIEKCQPVIESMEKNLEKEGCTTYSFCDDVNWDMKTVHMDYIEKYFRTLGFATEKVYRYEVWELHVKLKF